MTPWAPHLDFRIIVSLCSYKMAGHLYDLTGRGTTDKKLDCSAKSGTVGRSEHPVYVSLPYSSVLVTQSKEKPNERWGKDAVFLTPMRMAKVSVKSAWA